MNGVMDLDHIRYTAGEYPRITAIAKNGRYLGGQPGNWQVHDDHGWFRHSPDGGDWIGGWDYISAALKRMPIDKIVRVTVEVRDEDQEKEISRS